MKSQSKKVNPRKRVITEADLHKLTEKAANKAALDALKLADVLFLTVLLDKFDFNIEQLNRAWIELEKLSDEVKEHRISAHDLKTVLREEYYIDLDLKEK